MNTTKTVFLMVVLSVVLVTAGGAVGGRNGVTIALGIALVTNVFSYWFSDKIVLRMYGAKEVTESDAPVLYGVTRDLAMKMNLPMPKVYIIPTNSLNAFATGRNPNHAAVAATEGILRLLSREELTGVMAHELSHVANRDILIGTMAATLAAAITYLAHMAQWAMIFGGGRSRDDDRGGGGALAAIAMMILAPLAAGMVQMAISRSREYGADALGAKACGNPLWLASALKKMESSAKQVPMDASPATAHMFIVNPLRGGGIMKLFSTHPPMEERIARLEAMAYGPGVRK